MITLPNPEMAQQVDALLEQHPPLPVGRSIAPNADRFAAYVRQMCESRRFSNFGPVHEELRKELCELLSAERLSLLANATLALTIACARTASPAAR
jgi:dTDP-4-amino-4,6-dideoxygalactose transaminase